MNPETKRILKKAVDEVQNEEKIQAVLAVVVTDIGRSEAKKKELESMLEAFDIQTLNITKDMDGK